MSWLDPARWLGFDVESSGELPEYALQPWSDRAFLTSFSTSEFSGVAGDRKVSTAIYPALDTGITLATHPQSVEFVEVLKVHIDQMFCRAFAEDKYIMGWNTPFDASWLIKLGFREQVMSAKWLDAMLMWKHLTRIPESDKNKANRKKYGLKEAVAEFLPKHAGYGDDVDFHDFSPAATQKRRKYNRLDAGLTLQLAYMFAAKLCAPSRVAQRRALKIETAAIPLVADHIITGLAVNQDGTHALGASLSAERDELAGLLNTYGLTPTVLASPTKLRQILFEEWDLPVIKKTAKGIASTDKDVLYELGFIDDRIAAVQRYREIGGLRTKFVDNVLASAQYNSDGRTHPTAIIGSTYTGRMTYSSSVGKNKEKRQTGFAIHQMKRSAEFRRNIEVPEGYGLCEWDAASQEFRWCAIESNDEVMLSLCLPGEDAHSYMGSQMSDWTYRDLQLAAASGDKAGKLVRQSGKVGNLSCQFRIGPQSLLTTARTDYQLPWDLQMAKKVHSTYHRAYPGVKKYWDRKIREAKIVGYAETLGGRRVLLDGNWHNQNEQWKLESTAINFPIQGVGADQKYLAMMCIKPLLTKYNGHFYFELHDGLYAIFPLRKWEKAAYAGRELLSNLPYRKAWGFEPPIPLPWDLKLGQPGKQTWGDLVEAA